MKSKILISIVLSLLLFSLASAKDYASYLTIVPNQITVQPCGIATYDITLKNLGQKQDTFYSLVEGIPEGWYTLSHETIVLKPNESKTMYLFITADCFSQPKNYTGKISYLGNSESTASFKMNVIADRGLKIEAPEKITSCLCEESSFFVTIQNIGKYDEDIILSVTGATIKEKEMTIKAGERKQVELMLDKACDGKVGLYKVEIKAESKTSYVKTSAKFDVQRKNCYDFQVSYNKEFKSCVNVPVDFKIKVKNVGEKEDSFQTTIDALNFNQIVTLKPGESREFSTAFKGEELGIFDMAFTVKSTTKTLQGVIRFNIENCYGVDLQPETNTLEILVGTGKLLKAKISNTGIRQDTYTISSDINWVSIRPKTITLNGNETEDVFVYYSPEFGSIGEYKTKLIAESSKTRDEEEILIKVYKEKLNETTTTVLETTTTVEETQTLPTGSVTETKMRDLLKNKMFVALAAGIIVTLIIFSLIYLFVMRD